MNKKIYEYLGENKLIRELLSQEKVSYGNGNDDFNQLLIATDFILNDKTIFVVCPNIALSQKYYDSLLRFVNEEDVLFFPADELITAEMLASSNDFAYERLVTLQTLIKGEKKIVVTNTNGIIKREVPKEIFAESILRLVKGQEKSRLQLTQKLISLGYKLVYTTTKTGEFSKRGEIIDIFPFGSEQPVRLDFFDEEIESIKYFNPETQRSLEPINEVIINPVIEFLYDDGTLTKALKAIDLFLEGEELKDIEKNQIIADINYLNLRENTEKIMRYLSFFYEEKVGVLDYAQNKKIYYIDAVKIQEVYNGVLLDLNEYAMRLGGYALFKMEPFITLDKIKPNVLVEGLRTLGKVDYQIGCQEVIDYRSNEKQIVSDLKRYQKIRRILLSVPTERLRNILKKSLFENQVFYNEGEIYAPSDTAQIFFTDLDLPSVMLRDYDLAIINEHSLFDVEERVKKPKYKSIYKNALKISRYDELEVGDYIVHYDYGIGEYLGLKTMVNNGVSRDYLYIMYANKSSLYIPVEKISSIMKYASKDVPGVTLHEIGGTQWARTKEKVRKKIRDISDRLIKLYANREKTKGFAFLPDDTDQITFENEFDYELTPDQRAAVEAVKRDMEAPHPMDRLICGDVGYGKTEVALRAAFKAVYSGKQVAVLAPTTILSQQHFNTISSRMEKYGIKVELLNRFVSSKKQNEVLEGLASGFVDIVVGTHKILSPQISFHDLGLLIIDEEQRFGVVHKERIKEMKVNVDCLTLSATPIPRTLQMSMLGIKDLSMIETPPKNRYPIQTYVLARNDAIIRDAIERELARGGQVFYLYNNVTGIEEMAAKISSLVPEAKIVVAHGQLKATELEDRVYAFIRKEYNVLVCTTIIETGIDIPDTNTLIINDADHLGLSQLYQIRGRVGRSSKIAYAYLMYTPNKRITEEAEKRLEAIKQFNELGSGFKIAMRDLAIRGSGDLLGAEQSGFIESVGLEMYMKILNEEIHNIKPVEEKKEDASFKNPLLSNTVAEDYIANESVRIEIHKKIDKLETKADFTLLEQELLDRFGALDDKTYKYMWEKLFKNMLTRFGFEKINNDPLNNVTLIMDEKHSKVLDGQVWFVELTRHPRLNIKYVSPRIYLYGKSNNDMLGFIKEVINYLTEVEKQLVK